MSNHEERIYTDYVHMLMGLARNAHQQPKCIRVIDKGRGNEVDILESKLKVMGGYWRIHRTVNARCVNKARKHFLCKLIHHPEKASCIDSEWRTSLLQRECIYGKKKFMLDIDTKDVTKINKVLEESNVLEAQIYETPKGFHYVMEPFDTREVCKLDNVTLLRDGYYFIKEVGKR